jgi:ubiquinol-cytochrome c reductase cytochrome c1 subunit
MLGFFRLILFITASMFLMANAASASNTAHPQKEIAWSFDGIMGKVDKQSAQRGMQVYKEVCAVCHSLRLVSFRNLTELGFTEEEVKAFASQYSIQDGPNDQGEMFQRPGKPSDHFPNPFANKQAAIATHGAYPPDQSLIVKAREDGPNYIYSLLTGYGQTPPADFHVIEGAYYNPYFPGGLIKMTPPLTDGQVTYADGTTASVDQMARDVVNFLQWAAEPEMEARKNMGIQCMLFLIAFSILFYKAKLYVWRDVK